MVSETETFTKLKSTDEQEITDGVDFEILKVERLRALIFSIMVLFFAVVFYLNIRINYANTEFGKRVPVGIGEILLLSLAGFEFLIWYVLGHFLKARKKVPALWLYVGAFVEVSIPTIFIYRASIVLGAFAVFIPPVFLYFLIIALSGLRLSFSISVFTGAVAAIEYFCVACYITGASESTLPLSAKPIFMTLIHLVKCLMLFLAGLIAAIVTDKLKKGFLKSYQSYSEKKQIMNVFGQHVSPSVMEKLLHQKGETGGEIRNVCVMFLDIRSFTTFSENRSPQEVFTYLNTLFEFMIEIVNRNHGIINKFLGDGFMAVFGAPFSEGNDSQNAVRAAREILQKLHQEVEAKRILPTKVGIGLHAGNAVTGNVGSSQRKEYTIIGDAVNLASRVESLNKQFDSQLLISEAVRNAIGKDGEEAISLGKVTVKGRNDPVEVFKLA
jgi:adenylate cyclase